MHGHKIVPDQRKFILTAGEALVLLMVGQYPHQITHYCTQITPYLPLGNHKRARVPLPQRNLKI